MKQHKGKIAKWRKIKSVGGLGYFISGILCDQQATPIVHTSCVVLHDASGEIETKYSRYTLIGSERKE